MRSGGDDLKESATRALMLVRACTTLGSVHFRSQPTVG